MGKNRAMTETYWIGPLKYGIDSNFRVYLYEGHQPKAVAKRDALNEAQLALAQHAQSRLWIKIDKLKFQLEEAETAYRDLSHDLLKLDQFTEERL